MFAELDVEISDKEIVKTIKMFNSGISGGPGPEVIKLVHAQIN